MRHWARVRRSLLCGGAVVLGFGMPYVAQAAEPMPVAVTATGELPGIPAADLPSFLAKVMNGAGGNWRFEAAPSGGPAPANRIEWSFKTNPSAVGAVRTYGFSRATMQRLLGVHHYLTIEVTLYLHGQYQTQSLGQVTVTGGADDTDLSTEITRDTRQLMSYLSMDTRSDVALLARPSVS
jgi:hypothetical protein